MDRRSFLRGMAALAVAPGLASVAPTYNLHGFNGKWVNYNSTYYPPGDERRAIEDARLEELFAKRRVAGEIIFPL